MPPSSDSALLSPRFLFITGSLLVLLALTLSPRARYMLGIYDHGRWFLDSYAVLAAVEGAKAGFNPDATNPYDIFHRPHSYSDWWFGLGKLGLTRDDNFLVGCSWVLAFLAALFLTIKPRTWGEAFWLMLLASSPPVMLGLLRANNDLVIFAVLAAAVAALQKGTRLHLVLALAAVTLATGLKFYPVSAGIVFLLIPDARRRLVFTALAIVVLGFVLTAAGRQILRGAFHLEPEIYTMGGRIWLMDLGLTERPAVILSVVLFSVSAMMLAWCGWTDGLACDEQDPEPRITMTMAAALLICCFLGTVNFGYRWIFALWLAPWLWRRQPMSTAAKVAVWLLPFVLWHDGLLCLATALWFPNLGPEYYERILVAWRLGTEPLTWVLLALLGGWLAGLISVRGQEISKGWLRR